jgi:hypothetical protein
VVVGYCQLKRMFPAIRLIPVQYGRPTWTLFNTARNWLKIRPTHYVNIPIVNAPVEPHLITVVQQRSKEVI